MHGEPYNKHAIWLRKLKEELRNCWWQNLWYMYLFYEMTVWVERVKEYQKVFTYPRESSRRKPYEKMLTCRQDPLRKCRQWILDHETGKAADITDRPEKKIFFFIPILRPPLLFQQRAREICNTVCGIPRFLSEFGDDRNLSMIFNLGLDRVKVSHITFVQLCFPRE